MGILAFTNTDYILSKFTDIQSPIRYWLYTDMSCFARARVLYISKLIKTIDIYCYSIYTKIVTGPAKRDQVGTKYIILQNGIYLELRV